MSFHFCFPNALYSSLSIPFLSPAHSFADLNLIRRYALWLSGLEPNTQYGYANLTNWFQVLGGDPKYKPWTPAYKGKIAGAVVGGVIGVGLAITAIVIVVVRRRRAHKAAVAESRRERDEGEDAFRD